MASVRIHFHGSTHEDLPAVCIACGEPTGDAPAVPHRFRDGVHYLLWLMLRGQWRMRSVVVDMPLCEDHQGYWIPTKYARVVVLVFPILYFGTWAIIGLMQWMFVMTLVLASFWGAVSTFWFSDTILCQEIDEDGIALERVHEAFKQALLAERQQRLRELGEARALWLGEPEK